MGQTATISSSAKAKNRAWIGRSVVAFNRYKTGARDLIEMHYVARPPIIDLLAAIASSTLVIYDGVPNDVASNRRFRYRTRDDALIDIFYPRNSASACATRHCHQQDAPWAHSKLRLPIGFAPERLMRCIAVELDFDPFEVIRRNLE